MTSPLRRPPQPVGASSRGAPPLPSTTSEGPFNASSRPGHHRLKSYYADNITLAFANAPVVAGRDAVLAQMTTLLGKVQSLAHPLTNVWQEDGGLVIFEVTSIWRFHDDSEIEVNACSIFTLIDGRFTDQRIYVDNAPVNHVLS